jgi:hypothetical protein
MLAGNSSMEGVMDEAYNYGRNWITATLRNRDQTPLSLSLTVGF